MAAQGEVPGAVRTKSGRWRFKDTNELLDWIERMRRRTRSRCKQRFLHRDEAEIKRREKSLAKIRVAAESRVAKKRVIELTKQIAQMRGALSDVMTAHEIAILVRRSRRWVTMMVPTIPGAHFRKNRHLFQKSTELAAWIEAQRKISDLDRKLIPGDERIRRNPISSATSALLRCQRDIRRCFNQYPFKEWDKQAQASFTSSFNSFARTVLQLVS